MEVSLRITVAKRKHSSGAQLGSVARAGNSEAHYARKHRRKRIRKYVGQRVRTCAWNYVRSLASMLGNILLKRARDNAGKHVLKHIRKHAARESAADVLFISFGTALATTFCRLLLRQLPSPDSSKHVAPERIISRAHDLAPSSQSTPAWLLAFKYIANRNMRVKKGVPALSNRWALAISSRVGVGVRKYHRHDAISATGSGNGYTMTLPGGEKGVLQLARLSSMALASSFPIAFKRNANLALRYHGHASTEHPTPIRTSRPPHTLHPIANQVPLASQALGRFASSFFFFLPSSPSLFPPCSSSSSFRNLDCKTLSTVATKPFTPS